MGALHSLTAEPSQAASLRWKDRGQVSQDGLELRTARLQLQVALVWWDQGLCCFVIHTVRKFKIQGNRTRKHMSINTANQMCFRNN